MTEDFPATQHSPPLDLSPPEQPMTEGDNGSSDEYCEEIDTLYPLAEILEQFCQLKDQLTSLKSTTPQSTPTAELSQLTDTLQHLTMMLQPMPLPSEEPVHKTMQHTQTACMQHRENQTSPQPCSKIFPQLMNRIPQS